MNKAKKIIISVTNDLVADQRVHKVAQSLVKNNFDVLVVGRKLPNSQELKRQSYETKRMKLLFTKTAFFYAEYNLRLFFFLIFRKADIFLANDLDTLAANYFASILKKTKLVYDSHEYFTEVPELKNRKSVRKIWLSIEKFIVPKIKHSYTVCQSLAKIFSEKYGINMQIIKNYPICEKTNIQNSNKKIDIPEGKKVVLYQGSLNVDRGLESMIKAMQFIENAVLLIIGDGDISLQLKQLTKNLKLDEKVKFIGKIPYYHLPAYTKIASIGVSLEENTNLNYQYALPNKIFDYIQAGVPVLASSLAEIDLIYKKYNIGLQIKSHEPEHIAASILKMLDSNDLRKIWKNDLIKAAKEFCWEKQEIELLKIFL
ncbi:MAG: glycosyltransferase [Bacteroidetes bacterium]|nr:glycosyltransferase [Bacteroidota bacterium]MBT6687533.1 glycosyltransferase [Bacteroidota bacterium]MBT7142764.1 glycosyltransferase [Bacteroidota bacterium]MBT7491967.1 glycosyltransferase [Bacteroidota bacterium]